jgi:hypothetical protein
LKDCDCSRYLFKLLHTAFAAPTCRAAIPWLAGSSDAADIPDPDAVDISDATAGAPDTACVLDDAGIAAITAVPAEVAVPVEQQPSQKPSTSPEARS